MAAAANDNRPRPAFPADVLACLPEQGMRLTDAEAALVAAWIGTRPS